MRDYLSGYLSVLPPNQRKRIVDIILSNQDIAQNLTESDYKKLVDQLSKERTKITQFSPVNGGVDKVSSERFNLFNSQTYSDLVLLFNESDLIEEAIINYEYLHTSELNSLQREIDALKERIESLELAAQSKSVVITKSEDFSKSSNMETDTSYSHLFTDRDGTELSLANLQASGSKNVLTLCVVNSIDRLRDSSGNLLASIKLSDWRGKPVTQVTHPIANALDNSFVTFWGEVVLADEAVNIGLDEVSSGGTLCKIVIDLPKATTINEISLTPFTIYPLQIACIKYERDPKVFEPVKYIVPLNKPIESEDTMTIMFESLVAKRLTIYLRQKNFTTNLYTINEKERNSQELWNKISAEELGVTLDDADITDYNPTVEQDKLDQWSGWKTYLTALNTYKEQVQAYINSINQYNKQYNTNIQYDLPEWVKKLPGLNFGGGS